MDDHWDWQAMGSKQAWITTRNPENVAWKQQRGLVLLLLLKAWPWEPQDLSHGTTAQVTNGRRKVGNVGMFAFRGRTCREVVLAKLREPKNHRQFTISAPLLWPGHHHCLLLRAQRGARHHQNHETTPVTLGDENVLLQRFCRRVSRRRKGRFSILARAWPF
jgi:hypothetical protein